METGAFNWLAVSIGAAVISFPFFLYNIFQNGSLNQGTTAPFTHYEAVTSGLNLLLVGLYFWLAGYPRFGQSVAGFGTFVGVVSYFSLLKWYRSNPEYKWRRFEFFSKKSSDKT